LRARPAKGCGTRGSPSGFHSAAGKPARFPDGLATARGCPASLGQAARKRAETAPWWSALSWAVRRRGISPNFPRRGPLVLNRLGDFGGLDAQPAPSRSRLCYGCRVTVGCRAGKHPWPPLCLPRLRETHYAHKSYVVSSTSRFMLRTGMLFRGNRATRDDMQRVMR
jgi:hypothetical protein